MKHPVPVKFDFSISVPLSTHFSLFVWKLERFPPISPYYCSCSVSSSVFLHFPIHSYPLAVPSRLPLVLLQIPFNYRSRSILEQGSPVVESRSSDPVLGEGGDNRSDDGQLDDAVFEIYKRQKIKDLKRKLNIGALTDFNQLKFQKITHVEGPNQDHPSFCHDKCKGHAIGSFDSSGFKSKLECRYGTVFPLQIKHGICKLFDDHCMQLSLNEQKNSERLLFNILDLFDNVFHSSNQKLIFNGVGECGRTCCVHAKEKCAKVKKVSFNDPNNPAPHTGIEEDPHLHSSNVYLGVRNVDYAPDTFSPSPPHKSAPPRFICDPGPSRSYARTNDNLTSIDDTEDITEIIDGGTIKTPDNLVKFPLATVSGSPEVKFLGERKFDEKLRLMCNKSGQLYNDTLYSLKRSYRRATRDIDEAYTARGTDVAACSIINERYCLRTRHVPPDVVLERFNNNSKFHVTRQEIIHYMAVCSLSSSEPHHDLIVVLIGGCRVKYSSLGHSMVAGGKVGSFVMNAMCRKYFLDERLTISMKHYFFSCVGDVLMKDTQDFSYVQKCFDGASSVMPLPIVKMLFFPIRYDDHWFLFVVDLDNKYFLFFDSYYSKNDEYQIFARRKLIPRFRLVWDTFVGSEMHFDEFRIGYPYVPKHVGLIDGGVFVLKFLEIWRFGANISEAFSQSDIRNIRVQILNEMLFSKHNKADTSLVKNYYSPGHFSRSSH